MAENPGGGTETRRHSAAGAWRFPNPATPLGSSVYYSLRFAPPDLRDDLAAIAAWRHQVRTIPDRVSDPGVAQIKLQWWRDELERSFAGMPQHPLSRVLQPIVACHELPRTLFEAMADQVESEILCRQPADEADLDAACVRDLGTFFELIARCHGRNPADRLQTARRLGGFCARVYLIRDSGILARRGCAVLPAPAERLRACGLSSAALIRHEHRGPSPELLAPAADRARAELTAADGQSGLPLCLRVWVRISASLLDEIAGVGYDVAERHVGLTPLRKLWLAWRESRCPSLEPHRSTNLDER